MEFDASTTRLIKYFFIYIIFNNNAGDNIKVKNLSKTT